MGHLHDNVFLLLRLEFMSFFPFIFNFGSPHEFFFTSFFYLLFSNSDVGSFTSHKNKSVKVLWDRTYGFSSLSEKTRQSNHLKISFITKAALSSQLFKDLSVGPAGVWTCDLVLGRPTELTRRRFR